MRGGRRVLLAVIAAGWLGTDAAPAARKPPPCPGGRYVVHDEPLIAGQATALPDVVTIGGFQIAIGSGCAARPLNVRATWSGTRFRRRWLHCGGVVGPVVVTALIEPTCQVMTGRFVAPRAHVRRNFVATLGRCGDGLLDPGDDEQCEVPADCGGDATCTACRCVAAGTTSTSTVTTVSTSTVSSSTSSTSSTVTTTTSTSETTTTTSTSTTSTSSTSTTMPQADLVPTAFSAPPTIGTETSVALSWTVENQGTATAKAPWSDAVLLSADTVADAGDIPVGTVVQGTALAVGGSYPRTQSMTIPGVPAGPWFLLLRTNAGGTVTELDAGNDTRAVPVTVQTPDLVPTALGAPAVASADAPAALTWTIANQGTGDATPAWTDVVFLSTDGTIDVSDTQLVSTSHTQLLAAGASYDRPATVTLPRVHAGDYFLIVRTDNAGAVYEEHEDNDTRAVPLTIQTPDLVPTAFAAPASAGRGTTVSVSWTVANQGTGTAKPSWFDVVVFSADQVLTGTDSQLLSAQRSTPLAAGDSYDGAQTITVPNVTPGDYFLILRADRTGSLFQEDTTNDTRVVPITVTP